MTKLTNRELIQKFQDLIVNDPDLHLAAEEHANEHFRLAKIPIESVLEEHELYDENLESLWYGLVNEFMVSISSQRCSGPRHHHAVQPPSTTRLWPVT